MQIDFFKLQSNKFYFICLQADHILGNHPAAIDQIAIGEFLWSDDANETIINLRKDCQKMKLAIKHHQQSGEAAVRDIERICTRTGRGHEQASAITCNRSLVWTIGHHIWHRQSSHHFSISVHFD